MNRNGLDNRDENLITVTARENSQNKPVYANNRLGVKGVRKHAYKNGTVKYGARIRIDGKLTYLGQYGTLEEAKYWRDEAEFIFFHTSLSQRETVSAPRRP